MFGMLYRKPLVAIAFLALALPARALPTTIPLLAGVYDNPVKPMRDFIDGVCETSKKHQCGTAHGECVCPQGTICEEEKYIPPSQRCMPAALSTTTFGYQFMLHWASNITAYHLASRRDFFLGGFQGFIHSRRQSFWSYTGGSGDLCGGRDSQAKVYYNNDPWVKQGIFINKIEEQPACTFNIYVTGPFYY